MMSPSNDVIHQIVVSLLHSHTLFLFSCFVVEVYPSMRRKRQKKYSIRAVRYSHNSQKSPHIHIGGPDKSSQRAI